MKTAMEQGYEDAMLLLGRVYLEMEDPASARSMYQEYLQKSEQGAKAYNGLAMCDIYDGAYDSALENIAQGLKENSKEDEQGLLYNEIVAYEYKRDFATAKEKMKIYLEQYPEDEAALRENEFLLQDRRKSMYEMGEQLERVILAGVQTYESDDTVQSLYELRELAETAGAVTVGTIMQSRETIHPATYLGKGKLEELKELLYDLDATGVICDDELSPAQLNNLEQELECKVMDRTMVILDIFAQRAKTSEGKIQVELAQLKYRAARLVGMRASLSRLGGGIGTRGPGEKKLEMDRRLIHSRIGQLKEQAGAGAEAQGTDPQPAG